MDKTITEELNTGNYIETKVKKRSRRNKIIYWIVSVWLALGMTSTGIVQLVRMKEEVEKTSLNLGYPEYFLTILGIWKILGVISVLIPGYSLLKEWAYAGFFFVTTGAIISHLVMGSGAVDFIGPILLLLLTIVSWQYRPAGRTLKKVDSSFMVRSKVNSTQLV